MRLSVAEARKMVIGVNKRHKYGARKSTIDGIKFDSQKEAGKYAELILLQKAGEVVKIELQPEFILLEGFRRGKESIRPIIYRADFRVTYRDGRVVVIDVKGFRTKEYLLKRKLFLARYSDVEFEEA